MKFSWNSLKISIAGAKLSHLAQKQKIWDPGSMIEQAKTVFFKVKRAKQSGNIDNLQKYLSVNCFEKLRRELTDLEKNGKKWVIKNQVIKEASVIEVREAKNNKPDCFTALLKVKGIKFISNKDEPAESLNWPDRTRDFSEQWSFVSQGEWWVLDEMKENA